MLSSGTSSTHLSADNSESVLHYSLLVWLLKPSNVMTAREPAQVYVNIGQVTKVCFHHIPSRADVDLDTSPITHSCVSSRDQSFSKSAMEHELFKHCKRPNTELYRFHEGGKSIDTRKTTPNLWSKADETSASSATPRW